MDIRLDGKVAVITGGSRGIGKATAKSFAEAGARVLIVSRKQEILEAAAAEIGHDCEWAVANVADLDSANGAVDKAITELGGIDILVNNAAANPYAGPMIDADMPRWDKTIAVNVSAPLMWTQLAWTKWMKTNGGSVINVASVAALGTSRLLGVYGMTKAALVYQTEQLAAELAPKARVNVILPGLVKTDFARALWEDGRGDEVAAHYPMKRLGEPEDLAAAALFLASDASSWITGQSLVVDGGGVINFNAVEG